MAAQPVAWKSGIPSDEQVGHRKEKSIMRSSLLCVLGFHRWDRCKCKRPLVGCSFMYCGVVRDDAHTWQGCKCTVCGKVRDQDHDWHGCECEICSKKKEHDWEGCTCRRCGLVRNEEHDWNGCQCRVCHAIRNIEHDWDRCKCTVCGTARDQDHLWSGCRCNICGWHGNHDLNENCLCQRCGNVIHDFASNKVGGTEWLTCKRCGKQDAYYDN